MYVRGLAGEILKRFRWGFVSYPAAVYAVLCSAWGNFVQGDMIWISYVMLCHALCAPARDRNF